MGLANQLPNDGQFRPRPIGYQEFGNIGPNDARPGYICLVSEGLVDG